MTLGVCIYSSATHDLHFVPCGSTSSVSVLYVLNSLSGTTPAYRSRIFQFYIFQPCIIFDRRHFPVSHFQSPRIGVSIGPIATRVELYRHKRGNATAGSSHQQLRILRGETIPTQTNSAQNFHIPNSPRSNRWIKSY